MTASVDFLPKDGDPADANPDTTSHAHTFRSSRLVDTARISEPTYQAFLLLRVVLTVAPIVAGIDKFADVPVDWDQHLAPWLNDILADSAQDAMHVIGVGLMVGAPALWRLSVSRAGPPLVRMPRRERAHDARRARERVRLAQSRA